MFLISADILYAWYWDSYNESLLNETVVKGTRPDIGIEENVLISRSVVIERLKKILLPHKDQSFYYVVCGKHGMGKTILIKLASNKVGENKKRGIQGGSGVIYVDIPSDVEGFGDAFGKALNFKFEKNISFSKQLVKKIFSDTKDEDPKSPKWMRALKAFKHASAVYKKNNPCHQPPIIIYDNISRLIHIDPKILDLLQDDAKDNANDQNYITVFVCNEDSVLRRMESRSAWLYANPIEIGDLSKEESMEYLTNKRKINESEAKKLYELVGGRIVELKTVASELIAGDSFEVIKQRIFTKVEKSFKTAKLLKRQLHYKVGKKAIRALLDSKELSSKTFMEFFDDYEEADKVLEANVFAYHPENNTVSFQSQSVKCYIRENVDFLVIK